MHSNLYQSKQRDVDKKTDEYMNRQTYYGLLCYGAVFFSAPVWNMVSRGENPFKYSVMQGR